MTKNRFYTDFRYTEIETGYQYMMSELRGLDFKHPIRTLFMLAWEDFKNNKFSYDGATFVKERTIETIFEIASFIHDWRNSLGFVSKEVNQEFIAIMICLNYKKELIKERYLLLYFFGWVNVLRHKYILKDLKKGSPPYYFQLPEIFINPYTY